VKHGRIYYEKLTTVLFNSCIAKEFSTTSSWLCSIYF